MRLNEAQLAQAVAALKGGELVGLPTETVYGLAADATNPDAVERIFRVKGRPPEHPLILHLGDGSWLSRYTAHAPEAAHKLAEAFWPGPLSLVLQRAETVPLVVTGGLSTVAVRVPSHPVALQLLGALGRPLAAPSANRFGEVSPTTRAHVLRDLGEQVSLVLEGGACEIGVESTILDLSSSAPRILRPGGISAEQIEEVLRRKLADDDGWGPAAPGTLEAHYAPRAEVRVVEAEDVLGEVGRASKEGQRVGVFAPADLLRGLPATVQVRASGDARDTAHDLYAALRDLDAAGCDVIVTVLPTSEGIGRAVADRLRRAAVGSKRVP